MEPVSLLEPTTPLASPELEELAVEVLQKSAALASRLHPTVAHSVANLVRSMNCYYSNLIEGHNTYPIDIAEALSGNYATNSEQRDLQEEAVAHIHVQTLIDDGDYPSTPSSPEFLKWAHRLFYEQLPDSLRWVENPDTGERLPVVPGEFRTRDVKVGKHIGVQPQSLPLFLDRFHQVYGRGTTLQRIQNTPAAHHRLLWIHPFADGNGRVARLMTHAMFRNCGVGSGLWSVARGVARKEKEYKAALMQADSLRQGDLDGRGNLSQKALDRFSLFILEIVIDQIEFMGKMLDPAGLAARIDTYVQANPLPKGANAVLRETLFSGEVSRGQVANLVGTQERQARNIVKQLLEKGLLVSDDSRMPLRLGFPAKVLGSWFPSLYQNNVVSASHLTREETPVSVNHKNLTKSYAALRKA